MDSLGSVKKSASRKIKSIGEFISDKVWGRPPDDHALRLLRKGKACYMEHMYKEAKDALKGALEQKALQNQDECEALFYLGVSCFEMDELFEALQILDFACRTIRDHTLPEIKFEIYYHRALTHFELKQLVEASLDLKIAADIAEKNFPTTEKHVRVLFRKGKVEERLNDIENAVKSINLLLKLEPGHLEGKLLQLEFYLQLQDYEHLFDLFEEISDECKGDSVFSELSDSQNARFYSIKGTAEFRLKKYLDCVDSFTKALEFDKTLSEPRRLRGIAYFKLDEFIKGFHDLIGDATGTKDLNEFDPKINEKVQALEKVIKIPDEFYCPIYQTIMEDPVVAQDGHSYERSAIEEWLSTKDTSPMTNLPLSDKTVRPNIVLRNSINDLKDSVPSLFANH
jgi:tetratricopeptide (TPR) repeat protein